MIIGAIFCHVIIIKHANQFNPSIIEGNHKWKGIRLNFINSGIIISILKSLIKKIDLFKSKINSKMEAKA
jgi:hypothetical protein